MSVAYSPAVADPATLRMLPAHLHQYVGFRPTLHDQHAMAEQMSFTLMSECLGSPTSPFGRLGRRALVLNDETKGIIYDAVNPWGKLKRPYVQGSRPFLEKYLADVIGDERDPAEQVILLCQSMRSIPEKWPPAPAFLYGESEEDTILKGGGHCSCRGKLLTALCQMLGLEARPVLFWTWRDPAAPDELRGGHTVTEVLIDGQWGMFDPMAHLYCRLADGRFPSIAELQRDPQLLLTMDKALVEAMEPSISRALPEGQSLLAYYATRFLDMRCTTAFSWFDVNEKYEGNWTWATDEFRQKQKHDHVQFKTLLMAMADRGEITDELYRMGVDEARAALGITDGQLESQARACSAKAVSAGV